MAMTFRQKVGEAALDFALNCFDFDETKEANLVRLLGGLTNENRARLAAQRAYHAKVVQKASDLSAPYEVLFDEDSNLKQDAYAAASPVVQALYEVTYGDDNLAIALAEKLSEIEIDAVIWRIWEEHGKWGSLEFTVPFATKGASQLIREELAFEAVTSGEEELLDKLEALLKTPPPKKLWDWLVLEDMASGSVILSDARAIAKMKRGCSDIFIWVLARNLFEDCPDDHIGECLAAIETE